MITKGLLEKIYKAASIQRWNDHVRPVEFTELDKQAHKMVIAYIIGKHEEFQGRPKFNWIKLIEGGIFELLQRVILTDIKPPVFHWMMDKKGMELNKWVIEELANDIAGIKNLKEDMEKYLFNPDFFKEEKRILKAAHYLATNWEFKIIYNIAPFIYDIDKTKERIENEIEDHYDLIGVQKILLGKKTFGFIDLCGQLRFQQRWAQTPRVPKTSVLGHMLIVAIFSYLCSREIDACDKRVYNNFFAALFHDLPEALTRDISTPVKGAVEGLKETIKEYEEIQLEERLLPLLPLSWHEELRYFLGDEHQPKRRENGKTIPINKAEVNKYNEDKFSRLDGDIIKACDHLAAFIEACLSISHGIQSKTLKEAKNELYEDYQVRKKISGINFAQLFEYFYSEA